jgi:transposase
VVDTLGLLLSAVVHPANIQDRDGGVLAVAALFDRYPLLLKLFADGGYKGPRFRSGVRKQRRRLKVEIVKRTDTGFKVLPKRWVVKRTFGWFGRCRRLCKDFECLTRNALAFLRWASVRVMLRKLCNPA